MGLVESTWMQGKQNKLTFCKNLGLCCLKKKTNQFLKLKIARQIAVKFVFLFLQSDLFLFCVYNVCGYTHLRYGAFVEVR